MMLCLLFLRESTNHWFVFLPGAVTCCCLNQCKERQRSNGSMAKRAYVRSKLESRRHAIGLWKRTDVPFHPALSLIQNQLASY